MWVLVYFYVKGSRKDMKERNQRLQKRGLISFLVTRRSEVRRCWIEPRKQGMCVIISTNMQQKKISAKVIPATTRGPCPFLVSASILSLLHHRDSAPLILPSRYDEKSERKANCFRFTGRDRGKQQKEGGWYWHCWLIGKHTPCLHFCLLRHCTLPHQGFRKLPVNKPICSFYLREISFQEKYSRGKSHRLFSSKMHIYT